MARCIYTWFRALSNSVGSLPLPIRTKSDIKDILQQSNRILWFARTQGFLIGQFPTPHNLNAAYAMFLD